MSPAEVGFRLGRKLQGRAERAGFGLARPAPPRGCSGKPWTSELPRSIAPQRYLRAADRILEGTFDVFALRGAQLGFPPRWNVDPRTGTEAPLVFGKELDYRDPGRVGDIKYLWELNRHHELVTLAQAWHLSGDARYAVGCRRLVESWIAQCPYPRGAHWCVSLEHAIRLVNWAFAWHLLGGDHGVLWADSPGLALRERWLESIHCHCHFIAHHLSRHSSANNHLLGEATGLFVGAVTWPLWPDSARWARQAQAELAREALVQTFADGVNKEQAFWYHHAVADMMLVAGLFARANDLDFGGGYWRRLESMLEFIASIMDVGGNVPLVGDADEGVLVRLVPAEATESRSPSGVFRSLLATGAVVFGNPSLAAKAGGIDERTRWLLGDGAQAAVPPGAAAVLPVRRAFPAGGYFILGSDFETDREVRAVVDAGPLGYLAIAAHGHADALSFTLSVAGMPLLVDCGTFSYSSMPWRAYFRGTAAHNTVVVDGRDQSEQAGSFLWRAHARTVVETFRVTGCEQLLTASHDGYRRLSDPVRHRRTWQYLPGDSTLTVTDELLCRSTHRLAVGWHFAPECQVTLEGQDVVAARAGVSVRLRGPRELVAHLAMGQERPPLGWYSERVDVRVAAPTVVFSGEIGAGVSLRTLILIGR